MAAVGVSCPEKQSWVGAWKLHAQPERLTQAIGAIAIGWHQVGVAASPAAYHVRKAAVADNDWPNNHDRTNLAFSRDAFDANLSALSK